MLSETLLVTLLVIWVLCCVLILFERRIYRNIIYFGIFSLIASLCYLLLGAPDVAMAEAGISVFATIFFIVCIEKSYSRQGGAVREKSESMRRGRWIIKIAVPLVFSAGLFALFVRFMPDIPVNTYLKDQFLARFMTDVGGYNAVTAILLGYRVYDTLFEALILVVSVVAVAHMSWAEELSVPDGRHSEIENSNMAVFTMRIICPIILIFGAYLILNGHVAAGGGFLGGVAISTFFICRYYIYGIYDMPVKKVMRMEELVFIYFTLMAVLFVTLIGANIYLPSDFAEVYQHLYLIIMNTLIGLKVACGFFIIFYRYVTVERIEGELPAEEGGSQA